MLGPIFERLRLRPRELDLDDPKIALEKLEVFSAESGLKTPGHMARLFLQLVLRQALGDGALSVNIFYDEQDHCLRGLQYVRDKQTGKVTWHEFAPAPGDFAGQVLAELRRRVGVRRIGEQGTLAYRHEGSHKVATGVIAHENEVRIHFTAERPAMRTKLRPQKDGSDC
jgi:hypothetical protein